MRARAIGDEHLALRIVRHTSGCYLAMGNVDRALHMAFCEGVRPAHIHNDEIRIGRLQAFMHIPAIGLECEHLLEMPDGKF
jgi:hypothetical protein